MRLLQALMAALLTVAVGIAPAVAAMAPARGGASHSAPQATLLDQHEAAAPLDSRAESEAATLVPCPEGGHVSVSRSPDSSGAGPAYQHHSPAKQAGSDAAPSCCQLGCHVVASLNLVLRVSVTRVARAVPRTVSYDPQVPSALSARVERPPRLPRLV